MTVVVSQSGPLCGLPACSASTVCIAAYTALTAGLAYGAGEWACSAYALSFWHYYLYALAYYYGAIKLHDLKRDALLAKSVSLTVLAITYFAAPLHLASLAVAATGFLLNSMGAFALGSDRTYYGYELADLPPLRITSFPYSYLSHPMLIGNMAAYAGTLLNPVFFRHWWPLASVHAVLNLGLLLMELYIRPQRKRVVATNGNQRGSLWLNSGFVIAATLVLLAFAFSSQSGSAARPVPLIMALCAAACACILHRFYLPSRIDSEHAADKQRRETL